MGLAWEVGGSLEMWRRETTTLEYRGRLVARRWWACAFEHRVLPDENVGFHVTGAWGKQRFFHRLPPIFIFVFINVDAHPLVICVLIIVIVIVAGYETSNEVANSAGAAPFAT